VPSAGGAPGAKLAAKVSGARATTPHRSSYRLPPSKSATFRFGRPNPIIERVLVDKTEVCRGEENFVHVDVSTIDGTEADLRIWLTGDNYLGGNLTGSRIPVRMFGAMSVNSPPMVMVAGWGGTHAEQPLPFVKVKECNADPYLEIRAIRIDGHDLYEFSALMARQPAREVTWSFGDGTSVLSHEATVHHGYDGRRQLSAYAEFLIVATVTDGTGRVLHGYKTLELINQSYWEHRSG